MSFLSRLVDMMLGDPLEGNVRGLVSLDVEPPKGSGQLVTSKNPPAVFVCGGDEETPGPRMTNCPNELHDWPLPAGYTDVTIVANKRLRRGWKQRQCGCGLYGWVPGPDARPQDRVTLQGRVQDPSDYYQI